MIQFPNKNMSVVENQVVERLIADILAAGLTISVYDGEDYPLRYSTDAKAIIDALASTDEDELVLHEPINAQKLRMRAGWVRLIWGNDVDVISDYTTNIEHVLRRANALANRLDDVQRGFVKPTAPSRVRFWVFVNGGVARITVHKGDNVSWSEGGQTDEGFSYTGHSWEFDGKDVIYSQMTHASDCDGPISYGQTLYCKVEELAHTHSEGVAFPDWQRRGKSWQRDHNAEAAGY